MKQILLILVVLLSGCKVIDPFPSTHGHPGAAAYPVTYDGHDASTPSPETMTFIGDSYVYMGAWQTWFPGSCNDGVPMETVAQVLTRVQQMPSLPPTVYLWCGINDLQDGMPRDATMAFYGTLIDTVKAKGATRVICLSPMPLAPQYPWVTGHNLKPADVGVLCIQLSDVSAAHGAEWVNLWPAVVMPSGWCDPQYSQPAGIHLNEAGYDRVIALLQSANE